MEYAKKHEGNCPEWKVGDLKKPHIHFVVRFKNQRYASGVAKELRNKAGTVVTDATIRKCFNLYKAYVYLWHQNDLDKYQYNPDEVVGLHDFDPPEPNEGTVDRIAFERVAFIRCQRDIVSECRFFAHRFNLLHRQSNGLCRLCLLLQRFQFLFLFCCGSFGILQILFCLCHSVVQ